MIRASRTNIVIARLLCAAVILLTAACGARTTPPTPAALMAGDPALDRSGSGGTLRIGMSAGNLPYPNTPPNEGYEGRRFVGYQIYDGLLSYNLDQGDTVPTPHPGLATSWEVANDKLTWTLHLRQDVTFHDGTKFDANAVIFQFDRLIRKDFAYYDVSLAASNSTDITYIASYRMVDPYTVEIKTKYVYGFLPWNMTFIFIPSPTAVMTWGNAEYIKHAVGTGPFRMTRYVDGEVMELVANERYWRGRPTLDKIVLRPMPDPAARLAALQSGDVDWAEVPPPDSLGQLRTHGYNVLMKSYPHGIILNLNTYRAPFNDVRVRQALQYAIDREGMCNALLNGICEPGYQYMNRDSAWYDPSFGDRYLYNPEKARQMLADAGYPNGFSITIPYPTGGSGNMFPGPMMEMLQANFKKVGVEMKIVPMEWNSIISLGRAGFGVAANQQYDGYYTSPGPVSPTALLTFLSSRIPPKGCCNAAGYNSPRTDQLLGAAQDEFDQQKQDALLRQVMGQVAEDSPALFLVHDHNLRALSPSVRGFVQPQSWFADLRHVWIRR